MPMTTTRRHKIGRGPAQQSLQRRLADQGKMIGYNTAMPTCLFLVLDGTIYSMYQGVAANHGPEAEFRSQVATE